MTDSYKIEFTQWAEIIAVFDGRRQIDDIIYQRVTGF
jgi:hypothetical protein